MKTKIFIIFILIFTFSIHSEEFEETYNKMFELAGINPNSGLNSFVTLNIPPGGKYEGMGTAFTGVTNDIGFFNANPSVSSRLNLSEVSFFHNNWIEDVSMETIAFTGRKDDLGYGFQGKWLHVGFTGVDDWAERSGKGIYSEFVLKNNISYNFLRSFDFSGISVGSSLCLAYRSVPRDIYEDVITVDQSAMAIFMDFGISTDLNFLKFYSSRGRNLSLGISLMNFGREFIVRPDPLPTSAIAGFAYSPIESLTLTYDISYKFNLHEPNQDDFEFKITEGEGMHHAFGFEIGLIEFMSIHGGFLMKTGNPRITLGSEFSIKKDPGEFATTEKDVQRARNIYVFVVNYSLDLLPETPLNRISVEMKLNLGDYHRIEKREKVQELYVKGLQEYSEGNIEEAIVIWESCLKIDETFDPAVRMKALAEQSLELQKKIRDNQVVE